MHEDVQETEYPSAPMTSVRVREVLLALGRRVSSTRAASRRTTQAGSVQGRGIGGPRAARKGVRDPGMANLVEAPCTWHGPD